MIFDMSILRMIDVNWWSLSEKANTHPDNVLSSCLGSEHTQDARSTSHVQYGFIFEQMFIVQDGSTIRARPDGVLQHLLVNTYPTTDRP
jgi:hypothetical protein